MIQETINVLNSLDKEKVHSFVENVYRSVSARPSLLLATAGNGGSYANATHLVADLLRRGVPSICLSDNASFMTAVANDEHYNVALAETYFNYVSNISALFIFSVSGESANLMHLAKICSEAIPVYAVLGRQDSSLEAYCTDTLVIDHPDYGLVESLHQLIAHMIANRFKLI